MMRILLVVLTTLIGLPLFAQDKFEKEIRVKEHEVPKDALRMVDQLMPVQKIKWYKEYGKDHSTFEAKIKKDGFVYSIEFSEQGVFEDLEKHVGFDALPAAVIAAVRSVLEEAFLKYTLEKVQIQYSGNERELVQFIRGEVSGAGLSQLYELVVSAKEGGQFSQFEYLFDAQGALLQRRKIVLKDNQNLEY